MTLPTQPLTHVFVYGTLRRGQSNHGLLERSRFVSEGRTDAAFDLVDLGSYPAAVAGGATAVVGEVYEVSAATLVALDALEEHPTFYVRTEIVLAEGGPVSIYLLPARFAEGYPRIASGDWSQRG